MAPTTESSSGVPPVPPPKADKDLPPIPEISHSDHDAKSHANGNGNGNSNGNGNGFAAIFRPSFRTPAASIHSKHALEAEDYLNGGRPHHGGHQSPSVLSVSDVASPGGPSPTTEAASPSAHGAQDDGTVESPPETPGLSRRRDVQFSQSNTIIESSMGTHERQNSWENPSRPRQFMSRLKALAVQGSTPSTRTPASSLHDVAAPVSSASSPDRARAPRVAGSLNDGEGDNAADVDTDVDHNADADAEETADEAATDGGNRPKRHKRRMYHHKKSKSAAVMGGMSFSGMSRFTTEPMSPLSPNGHPGFLQRRSTMPDILDHPGGMSEGEGRDRLMRHGWRRGSSWVGRGDLQGDGEARAGRVTRHVRRSTVFGGGVSDGDAMALTPRRNFFPADRTMTYGVQKWRQMKNTLKAFRPKKEEFDYLKSAELMAELRAGAPAVLMLASMIQRDEHGNKRIPVLLEQLRLRIRDSTPVQDGDSERHWLFAIDLEYGSGPSRMKWTVKRTIGEILEMHLKYKLTRNDKYLHLPQSGIRPKQPKFPVSAFPYVRSLRGVKFDDEDDAGSIHSDDGAGNASTSALPAPPALDGHVTAGEATAGEGTGTDAEGNRTGRPRRKSRMTNVLGMSRRSSGLAGMDGAAMAGDGAGGGPIDEAAVRRKYVEKQQRVLEKYLTEMIHWLIFRADSNRLCRFLELSALGVRLAAEGSYHGKECFLHIQSSKGLDFRRVLTPGKVIERHSRKWFLVRQSYIVCVESPENMNIYDVYLVDPKFLIISKNKRSKHQLANGKLSESAAAAAEMESMSTTNSKNRLKQHTLTLLTSERKVKLWARNQHLIGQFEESICDMLKQTPWHRRNRFDSFAPVRTGVFAQWLVDGRDYMWNVSRAIAMAKDVIYIHDWWLSPELYMRRPACISQKWRLDRLLQRKAQEGVKIFVIVYRNVEAAIPIDSEYTKFSLLNLHPNIFVQRSPNQFKKNQFFFAHHEKICVVDHDVAFVGGIDLCFGRWDSPQHTLVDDKPTGFEQDDLAAPKDADHTQLWPGKDYSNPRVQDFFSLREPYKEMYDRTKVPRMPWHDVGMQIVGQPARDLTRHFVQRWNYVRRGRKPTRPTPFLLPPPDYRQEDLESLGLAGTCEVQILRSASAWSLGITDVECSIQTAYISMIEESEHFVYMENQFFITSTETLNVKIINRIGDALVERIMRAYKNEEDWRCVIIIPLMPGFESSVADQEGTSVRLILQCQYRSICRGENSIFGRLRAAGIEPEEYIQFFSLRQWGKINNKSVLTTEQLYIHAKTIVVDDRVALIGSANINERSLLGDRDSETAAIVRDRDMIESTMAGRPYLVGRFAHTLRLRLMQEHLGLDTDEIMEEARREAEFEAEMHEMYSDGGGNPEDYADAEAEAAADAGDDRSSTGSEFSPGTRSPAPDTAVDSTKAAEAAAAAAAQAGPSTNPYPEVMRHLSYNHDIDLHGYGSDSTASVRSNKGKKKKTKRPVSAAAASSDGKASQATRGLSSRDEDHWASAKQKGTDRLRDTGLVDNHEVLLITAFDHGPASNKKEDLYLSIPKGGRHAHRPKSSQASAPTSPVGTVHEMLPPQPSAKEMPTSPVGVLPPLPVTDDTDIGGPSGRPVNPLAADIHLAQITKDCMRDPLDPAFYDDVWNRVAENNTKIYRRVFRCMPDSEARNWHEFQEFNAYSERFQASMEARTKTDGGEDVSESMNARQHQPRNHGRTAAGGGAGAGVSIPTPAGLAAVSAMGEKASNAVLHLNSNENENEKRNGSAGNDSFGRPATKESYPSETEMGPGMDDEAAAAATAAATNGKGKSRRATFSEQEKPPRVPDKDPVGGGGMPTLAPPPTPTPGPTVQGSVRKRRRATTRSSRRGAHGGFDELLSKADAEELCNMIQGHVVQFPYDWLLTEEGNGNWLYQVDQVAPIQIYN